MLENLRPTEAEYRDGITRARRMLDALDPGQTAWEDRTLNDWLHFVQEFSHMVHYVADTNQREGYWEGLLSPQRNWAQAFATEGERTEALADFRALLVAFANQELPETTTANTLDQLSRPHRVLLLIFLKLLEQFRDPFNHLVARHLHYQMEDLLRFRPRSARRDSLGVSVRLETNAPPTLLPQGSLLDAGEDAEGHPLQYATEHDTWLHTTQLTDVKNLYMEKRLDTLASVHLAHDSEVDHGFQKLLEFAIGEKGIGTPLAELPEGTKDLYALRNALAEKSTLKRGEKFSDPHWVYLYQHLYMDFGTFSNLLDIQTRYMDPLTELHTNEWPLAYGYLEGAYLRKQVEDRKQYLQTLYQADPGPDGYRAMLQYAFGEPQPGDALPEYLAIPANPDTLYADLKGTDNSRKNLAEKYLADEWSMEAQEFQRLHELMQGDKSPEVWDEATALLESAWRQKRRIHATVPQREVVGNLYAADDPRTQLSTVNKDASHQAWPLFGSDAAPMPTLGFQISSPLLAMGGGERSVRLYLSLDRHTLTQATLDLLQNLDTEKSLPIQSVVRVNGEEVPPNTLSYAFANYVFGEEEDRWTLQVDGDTLVVSESSGTEIQQWLGKIVLLDAAGVLRKPLETEKANTLTFETLGQLAAEEMPTLNPPLTAGAMAVFLPERVFTHSICLEYHFALDAPSLFPESAGAVPELSITFDPTFEPSEYAWPWFGMLPALRDLKVAQMHLAVQVEGLPLELALNDNVSLDTATPYTPFGNPCDPGNSFYFTHREVAAKPLDSLSLDVEWMQLPENFKDYYATYPELTGNPLVGQKDENLPQVRLRFRDGALPLVVAEDVALFPSPKQDAYHRIHVPVKAQLAQRYSDYAYPYQEVAAARNLLDHSRYFTLEYTGPSFGETHYQIANLLFFQKLSAAEAMDNLTKPPEPYVPKAKAMMLAYTCSVTRTSKPDATAQQLLDCQYQTPFGKRPFASQGPYFLIPEFQLEGECYLGIEPVQPGQVLSFWIQMAEGSAQPDTATPTVELYYPSAEGWTRFSDRQLIRDTTQGLTQSGMVYLQLPDTLVATPELPPGSYWLRLGIARDTGGLPLAITIRTNGVSAVLAPGPRAASHYERPLPAETITELVDSPIAIAHVEQPFSSSHGLPQEQPQAMYIRAGERIRHKHRALTQWDYERLVINQFAEVYKVRCLSADATRFESPGAVQVVVIPDLRGKTPFDPLQPKLPESRLAAISDYLHQYSPPSATLEVANPRYVEVRVRFAVRIRPGYSAELSREELQVAVKRFLSPWAFEEGQEITFGGEIYANALVGYVETLPYVDYVARVRLFKRESGDKFIAIQDTDGLYRVAVSEPDRILVSADSHDIDLISDAGYELSSFAGIEHDKIELDFQVGDD